MRNHSVTQSYKQLLKLFYSLGNNFLNVIELDFEQRGVIYESL